MARKRLQLAQFCGPIDSRISKPRREGQYVYASDRKIVIQVDAKDYPKVKERHDGLVFSRVLDEHYNPGVRFKPMPKIENDEELLLRRCVIIQGVSIERNYALLLCSLPGIRVRPGKLTRSRKNHFPALEFRFNGGRGVLAGMVYKEKE